jgi:hypothetical protein
LIYYITDPAWNDLTWDVYVTYKRTRAVAKAARTSTPAVTTVTPVRSTIYFSADVLLTDMKGQEKPPTPGTTGNLKPHKLWKFPFAVASCNSSNIRQLHNMDLVLALSKQLDVIGFYRKLVEAKKPTEIDLIPFARFDPDCALWPNICCADIVFEMNDALNLRPDQTGTLNLDDETINILYQKHIIDSICVICAYDFLNELLKKATRQLNEHMPMPPDIEQATTSIGSFGANLERCYLQLSTLGATFEEGIEVNRFVDHLDNVTDADPLPDELILTELILHIKNIHSLQSSSIAVINCVIHDTQKRHVRSSLSSSSPEA